MPKITFKHQAKAATFRVTETQIKTWLVMKKLGIPFHAQVIEAKKIKSRNSKYHDEFQYLHVKHLPTGEWIFVGEP